MLPEIHDQRELDLRGADRSTVIRRVELEVAQLHRDDAVRIVTTDPQTVTALPEWVNNRSNLDLVEQSEEEDDLHETIYVHTIQRTR